MIDDVLIVDLITRTCVINANGLVCTSIGAPKEAVNEVTSDHICEKGGFSHHRNPSVPTYPSIACSLSPLISQSPAVDGHESIPRFSDHDNDHPQGALQRRFV